MSLDLNQIGADNNANIAINENNQYTSNAVCVRNTIAMTDADLTLTAVENPTRSSNATQQWRYRTLEFTGTLTASRDVIFPTFVEDFRVLVINNTNMEIDFKKSGQSGITIPVGGEVELVAGNTDMEIYDRSNIVINQTGVSGAGAINLNTIKFGTTQYRTITLTAAWTPNFSGFSSSGTETRIRLQITNNNFIISGSTNLTFIDGTVDGDMTVIGDVFLEIWTVNGGTTIFAVLLGTDV